MLKFCFIADSVLRHRHLWRSRWSLLGTLKSRNKHCFRFQLLYVFFGYLDPGCNFCRKWKWMILGWPDWYFGLKTPLVQVHLDTSDCHKLDCFLGTGIFFQSDFFRRESELTKARKTANALRKVSSMPFCGAIPPTDAPAKKYRSWKKSETCWTPDGLGSEETRDTQVCKMGTIQTWVTLLATKCLRKIIQKVFRTASSSKFCPFLTMSPPCRTVSDPEKFPRNVCCI